MEAPAPQPPPRPPSSAGGSGRIGQRVGPYRLLQLLGRGGMGAVYRARHEQIGAEHALKVLTGAAGGASPTAVSRFQREVEVLGRLGGHPGIVRVHACGVEGNVPWYAMELVAGEPLAARLRGGPMKAVDAARLVATLADAVAHAHGLAVVHRDLKPENVLIEADGQPRLVDFGLAFDAFSDRLTKTGAFLGTPAYMAPEQISRPSGSGSGSASGERSIGPACDVYGLGAILYAALTARPPFEGADQMKLIVKVMNERPERPSRVNPGVPPELDAVCLCALEKDPAERYAGARELATDLQRFLGGLPVHARAPTALSSIIGRWRPRTRGGRTAVVSAVAAVFLALLAATLWSLGVAKLGASPAEQVRALEEAVDRAGRLDPEQVARARAIAEAGADADPELVRRARLLGLLAAALDAAEPAARRLAARELAGLLRPGGAVDRAAMRRAQKALGGAGRIDALAWVLLGTEPIEPASAERAADLALRLAAAAPEDDLPPVPDDDAAFSALYRAGRIDDAVKGRLLVRRAERAVASRGEAAHGAALGMLLDAQRLHGVDADMARWTPAFREHVLEAFLAEVKRSPREARGLLDLIIRAEDDRVEPSMGLVVRMQEEVLLGSGGLLTGTAELRDPEKRDRLLALAALVERYGYSPLATITYERLRGGLSTDYLLEVGRAELTRPPSRRNPATLIVLTRLLVSGENRPDDPEIDRVRRIGRDWCLAAEETGIEQVWLLVHIGQILWLSGFHAEGIARARRAWELDRKRPLRQRWSAAGRTYADMLSVARSLEPDLHDLDRAALVALDASEVQLVWDPLLDELVDRGGIAPSLRKLGDELANELTTSATLLARRGPPGCCGGEDGTGPKVAVLLDRVIELEAERASRPRVVAARELHREKHEKAGVPVAR